VHPAGRQLGEHRGGGVAAEGPDLGGAARRRGEGGRTAFPTRAGDTAPWRGGAS
jgi:hypothetical protein